ncbi:hypothetical protein BKA67DRAFT_97086 [Truncatella angustata]|uniref:Uncharacterized protein n=1 Tax=Truncatella angustata TaxID=152316 RepID=A0A9P8RN70_9PEZI|nr:uncharacterized protein BKA67DRAFT_97086 [Truncatella angustata]KAH6646241.1 hypothetical protein BKA67DRAFT_97086 [Truncatella angustata]
MWRYVEKADFNNIAMTLMGNLVFPALTGPWTLVDQEALNTGKLPLREFENNVQSAANCRLRPWVMHDFWPRIEGLSKPLEDALESRMTLGKEWRQITITQISGLVAS